MGDEKKLPINEQPIWGGGGGGQDKLTEPLGRINQILVLTQLKSSNPSLPPHPGDRWWQVAQESPRVQGRGGFFWTSLRQPVWLCAHRLSLSFSIRLHARCCTGYLKRLIPPPAWLSALLAPFLWLRVLFSHSAVILFLIVYVRRTLILIKVLKIIIMTTTLKIVGSTW